MAFTLQGSPHATCTACRWLTSSSSGAARVFRALLRGSLRGCRWRRQLHARPPSFREPDRNRLFRRPRAVLALAHVMNLLADELSSLRRRRVSLPLVTASTLECGLLRHSPSWTLLRQSRMTAAQSSEVNARAGPTRRRTVFGQHQELYVVGF